LGECQIGFPAVGTIGKSGALDDPDGSSDAFGAGSGRRGRRLCPVVPVPASCAWKRMARTVAPAVGSAKKYRLSGRTQRKVL